MPSPPQPQRARPRPCPRPCSVGSFGRSFPLLRVLGLLALRLRALGSVGSLLSPSVAAGSARARWGLPHPAWVGSPSVGAVAVPAPARFTPPLRWLAGVLTICVAPCAPRRPRPSVAACLGLGLRRLPPLLRVRARPLIAHTTPAQRAHNARRVRFAYNNVKKWRLHLEITNVFRIFAPDLRSQRGRCCSAALPSGRFFQYGKDNEHGWSRKGKDRFYRLLRSRW